jgi:hypothetical protein
LSDRFQNEMGKPNRKENRRWRPNSVFFETDYDSVHVICPGKLSCGNWKVPASDPVKKYIT